MEGADRRPAASPRCAWHALAHFGGPVGNVIAAMRLPASACWRSGGRPTTARLGAAAPKHEPGPSVCRTAAQRGLSRALLVSSAAGQSGGTPGSRAETRSPISGPGSWSRDGSSLVAGALARSSGGGGLRGRVAAGCRPSVYPRDPLRPTNSAEYRRPHRMLKRIALLTLLPLMQATLPTWCWRRTTRPMIRAWSPRASSTSIRPQYRGYG
jgi:hypothetical protein